MNILKLIVVGWLAVVTVLAQMASLPELKKQFETDVRAAQQQQREKLKAAGTQYLKVLDFAEQKIQEKGNEEALAWVRAERKRFEQAGDMPESALGRGPLRRAQETWQEQASQAKLAQAQRTTELAKKYLQELARLQQQAGNSNALAAVNDETDRVLSSSVIREALELAKTAKPAAESATPATQPPAEPAKPAPVVVPRPLTGPVTVGDYKIYPQGKEPSAKELKSMRLEFPNVASRSAASAYSLGVGVFSDKSKLETDRQNAGSIAFKQERGLIHSAARITVACHGRDMAGDSQLVVHYFSRPANSLSEVHEERVERIALPALPRGQTVVVDGAGILLGKFEHRGAHAHLKAGDEFYGVIVSLFDPAGKLLIQQCSSSALAKACPASLPAEKPQEGLRARYGGGGPP